MNQREREEEQAEDDKLERMIELAKIRPVWVGDNGYVPKPRSRDEKVRVRQFRPRA